MISVKARWERWCRWNCDLRVINARKKALSVVQKASPWRPNHVTICLLRHSGESLQNGQLELRRRNWYFARDTHKDTAVSVWQASGRILKEYQNIVSASKETPCGIHGVCEIALIEVLATQMGVMRRSKKVSSFELYKLNALSPHYGSIARALLYLGSSANCYSSRQHSIVNFFVDTVYWRI